MQAALERIALAEEKDWGYIHPERIMVAYARKILEIAKDAPWKSDMLIGMDPENFIPITPIKVWLEET
jgi:hypothetical protein